jgi:primosomal protein N' (replication factor Y)
MFVDVIVPLPLPELYTYSVPNEWYTGLNIGCRVVVQFGAKKNITGIVYRKHENKPKAYETKPILEILDTYPIVN